MRERMNADKKIPHPPQRMNILGRKRYSGDANAKDVIEFSFDDCWRTISWLWFLLIVLSMAVIWGQLKEGLNNIANLLNTQTNIDII